MYRLLAILCLGLMGCTANGAAFKDISINKSENATIIVYKKQAYIGKDAQYSPLYINGVSSCSLHTGSFYVYKSKPGIVQISSSTWDTPGISEIKFNTKSNGIYYIRMDANDEKQAIAMAGGIIGLMLAESISQNKASFTFINISPEQALQELAELKKDC